MEEGARRVAGGRPEGGLRARYGRPYAGRRTTLGHTAGIAYRSCAYQLHGTLPTRKQRGTLSRFVPQRGTGQLPYWLDRDCIVFVCRIHG